MAIIKTDEREIEIDDNESVIDACEQLGVPFYCYAGICGSCRIKIIEGGENLTILTDEERNFGIGKDERLACQCKIKKGEVKIFLD